MPIYCIGEVPRNGWYEERIPNGKYRYIGSYAGIRFEIHANTPKTKDQVQKMIENNVDGWINREGCITNLN